MKPNFTGILISYLFCLRVCANWQAHFARLTAALSTIEPFDWRM